MQPRYCLVFFSHCLACDLVGHTGHPDPLSGQHDVLNLVTQPGSPHKVKAIKVIVCIFTEKVVEKMVALT